MGVWEEDVLGIKKKREVIWCILRVNILRVGLFGNKLNSFCQQDSYYLRNVYVSFMIKKVYNLKIEIYEYWFFLDMFCDLCYCF